MKIEITNESTGEKKEVGHIDGFTYFTIRFPKHYFIKYQGFGISKKILEYLNNFDIQYVIIKYISAEGSESMYKCKLSDYLDSKLEYSDKDDTQKFIPIKDMVRLK